MSQFFGTSIFFLLLVLIFSPSLSQSTEIDRSAITESEKEYYEKIKRILGDYDPMLSPSYFEQTYHPTEIDVTMHIIDISLISEESMDFKIDFYFRQLWNDSRFAADEFETPITFRFNRPILNKIWKPDTFVSNVKKIDENSYGTFSDGNAFVKIKSNGSIFYSHRMSVVINCANNLMYFPMDNPICKLEFESYGFSAADIKYRFSKIRKNPVTIGDEFKSLLSFDLKREVINDENVITFNSGTYSRLIVQIHLKRRCEFYLINIYLPTILLVIISWFPFYMDPEKFQNARLMVSGFASISMILMLISTIGFILPSHHTLRAIDFYMFFSILMIFLAFISSMTTHDSGEGSIKTYKVEHCQIVNGSSYKNRLSKILFPIVFALFNIVYVFTLWFASK